MFLFLDTSQESLKHYLSNSTFFSHRLLITFPCSLFRLFFFSSRSSVILRQAKKNDRQGIKIKQSVTSREKERDKRPMRKQSRSGIHGDKRRFVVLLTVSLNSKTQSGKRKRCHFALNNTPTNWFDVLLTWHSEARECCVQGPGCATASQKMPESL